MGGERKTSQRTICEDTDRSYGEKECGAQKQKRQNLTRKRKKKPSYGKGTNANIIGTYLSGANMELRRVD